jgi:hypothetical protein
MFIILAQAPIAAQPGKGALDHPAPGQHPRISKQALKP